MGEVVELADLATRAMAVAGAYQVVNTPDRGIDEFDRPEYISRRADTRTVLRSACKGRRWIRQGMLRMIFMDKVSPPGLSAWAIRELTPDELHLVSGGDDGGGCGPGDCGDSASGGDSCGDTGACDDGQGMLGDNGNHPACVAAEDDQPCNPVAIPGLDIPNYPGLLAKLLGY